MSDCFIPLDLDAIESRVNERPIYAGYVHRESLEGQTMLALTAEVRRLRARHQAIRNADPLPQPCCENAQNWHAAAAGNAQTTRAILLEQDAAHDAITGAIGKATWVRNDASGNLMRWWDVAAEEIAELKRLAP